MLLMEKETAGMGLTWDGNCSGVCAPHFQLLAQILPCVRRDVVPARSIVAQWQFSMHLEADISIEC